MEISILNLKLYYAMCNDDLLQLTFLKTSKEVGMRSKRLRAQDKVLVEEYESQRLENNENKRDEKATSDVTTYMYKDNEAAKALEESHSLKKFKVGNTRKAIKVTKRVKKIVTTITTTYTTVTTKVDDLVSYYSTDPSEFEPVKAIKSSGVHEKQFFEGNITTDVSDTSTTETTTVHEDIISESDEASLYDEFVVARAESSQVLDQCRV